MQVMYHKTDIRYDDVVLIDSDTTDLKSNIIYVCYASKLNNMVFTDSTLTFFIINDSEISNKILQMKHLIIYQFKNTENMFNLYNYLQKLFTKRRKNYTYIEDLVRLMMQNNNLDMITDKVSLFLQNPLAIIDSSYKIISASSTIKTDDPVWNTGLKRGTLTFEFIAKIKSIDKNNFEDNPDYRILEFSGISFHKRKLCKLFMENTFLGYCLILESNTRVDNIPNSYYSFIMELLSKEVSIKNMNMKQSFISSYESLLLDLINKRFVSKSIFSERIRNTKFDINGKFTIVSINMNNFIDNNILIQGTFKEQLYNLLPHSCSIFYDNYIVILINLNSTYYNQEDALNPFINMLKNYKLKAGFSDYFTDLYELSSYYQQSISCLHIADYLNDTSNIILYDEYKAYDIIETINCSRDPLSFCINCVKEVYKYDQKNKTEYTKTLFAYLNNDRSITKTAQDLFIHRNTVNYRISRIKDLFNISFDDVATNCQILYSCLTLNYVNNKLALKH